ncbi:hypothetical protein pb186bvf_020556 [Paramecium bursaria]
MRNSYFIKFLIQYLLTDRNVIQLLNYLEIINFLKINQIRIQKSCSLNLRIFEKQSVRNFREKKSQTKLKKRQINNNNPLIVQESLLRVGLFISLKVIVIQLYAEMQKDQI